MDANTKFFRTLSDINRLRILRALLIRELCVCEIRELLGLASSTVSQHLKILKEAGFILEQKNGKWVNYRINEHPSDERIPALLEQLDFWMQNAELVASDLQKISRLDRKLLCSSG